MSGSKISKTVTNRGFTIVELLIIAPIVILFLGGFITAIVNMTGDVLASRSSSALVYDIQDSLDRIEQDVKLSSTFLAINNKTPLTSPQGYNNDTTNFTNIDSVKGDMLILNSLATNGNPLLATSSLFYLDDQPNDCTSTQLNQNIPMTMNIVYFVKDGSLWRRVIAPADYNTAGCPVPPALPWQQPSCNPTFMIEQPGSSTFCAAQDAKLLESVDPEDFVIEYFNTADATTANSVASSDPDPAVRNTALQSATTVSVSLNIDKIAAGRNINQSGTIRVTRLDTNASTIAPVVTPTTPSAPTVAVSHSSPVSAVFTWPTVPGATGYTFQYRINGGSWQTAFTNQNTTTYTATADHEDIVDGRASATNSAGTSGYSSLASLTIPLWASIVLQNSWSDYDTTMASAGYTKTSSGIIMLKGSLKRTGTVVSGEVIGTLPPGYRPPYQFTFIVAITGGDTASLQIHTNGNIVAHTDFNATYSSLDRVAFLPSDTSYTWTNFSPISNGWSNRNATDDPPFSYTVDSTGRFHMRGALSPGTITDGTTIVTLPVAGQMNPKYIMAVRSGGGGLNAVNVGTSSGTTLSPRGISAGTALFPNLSYFSNSYSDWTALPLVNSWTNYDGNNTTAAYTKASDGVVSLKGLIRSGSSATATVATLPEGFRPKERVNFASVCSQAACRVNIYPSGTINLTQGSTSWSSLSGINFIAEQ
jgi:hypothetical protein